MTARWALLIVAASARAAAAPERASATASRPAVETRSEPGAAPTSRELTAADVDGAPVPGAESGRIDVVDDRDSLLRRGLRGVLFVPKLAADAVFTPVRGVVWASSRYHFVERYNRLFFNDALTIGLIPTAAFESGFGINVGARFVARDLFGAREHLSIKAATGGRYRQSYSAWLRSGDRLGDRVAFDLGAEYEHRPEDPFYGIGDHDDSMRPETPVDPRVDPAAVETRYRERIARLASVLDVRPFGSLHLRSSIELTDRAFSTSEHGVPIEAVYDPAALVGYRDGVRDGYAEVELRFDSRGRGSRFEPYPFYAVGWLAAGFAGRVHRLDDAAADYWRYGLDVQHFLRLAQGPRVLALRLHGEAVSGSRADVPFSGLPQLGGNDLRGYPSDRFRDRLAALGSVAYEWDLSQLISASLFVDAGRVFPSFEDLSLAHMRVGYGVALEGHTERAFGVTGSLASSIDGGLFLNLSFNQVFDLDERVRRR